jgi:hypothetical protein
MGIVVGYGDDEKLLVVDTGVEFKLVDGLEAVNRVFVGDEKLLDSGETAEWRELDREEK